jgi:hypothetical protein
VEPPISEHTPSGFYCAGCHQPVSSERLRLLHLNPGLWFACESDWCDWVQIRTHRARFEFASREAARIHDTPLVGEPRRTESQPRLVPDLTEASVSQPFLSVEPPIRIVDDHSTDVHVTDELPRISWSNISSPATRHGAVLPTSGMASESPEEVAPRASLDRPPVRQPPSPVAIEREVTPRPVPLRKRRGLRRQGLLVVPILVLLIVGAGLLVLITRAGRSDTRAQTAPPTPSFALSAESTSLPIASPVDSALPPPPGMPADAAPSGALSWFEAGSTETAAIWPNNPGGTAWFAGGEYHLFARQPGRFVAIGAPIAMPLRDVTVHARFRKVGGPPGGGYGIIVRDAGPGPRDGVSQQGHYYVLEAGDRGEFGIWRREGDRWIDMVPWSRTSAMIPGTASNELTVTASGDRLLLAINGVEVGHVVDATLAEGTVGIFVGGDLNEVAVERYVVEP